MSTLIDEQMTETAQAEVSRLVQEGRAAVLAGDTFAARSAFRRAAELDPNSVDAWVGLSSAVPILAEKRDYLQRALALNADHTEARASLEYVQKLIAEGMQLAPPQRTRERRENGDASPLLATAEPEVAPQVETLYCYVHPDRETGLRCVQCARPICGSCAQVTPVGQLCPECRKTRRPPNYQVEVGHMVLGGLVALGVGVLGSIALVFVTQVPFIGLFLALAGGALAGNMAVRASDRVTRLKRGRAMQIVVACGLIAGTLPLVLITLLNPSLLTLIVVLYLILAVAASARTLK